MSELQPKAIEAYRDAADIEANCCLSVGGKFGHHADPEIDADLEVERLQGLLCEAHAGLLRALDYRAATPEGLAIKYDVRDTLRRTGYAGVYGARSNF